MFVFSIFMLYYTCLKHISIFKNVLNNIVHLSILFRFDNKTIAKSIDKQQNTDMLLNLVLHIVNENLYWQWEPFEPNYIKLKAFY